MVTGRSSGLSIASNSGTTQGLPDLRGRGGAAPSPESLPLTHSASHSGLLAKGGGLRLLATVILGGALVAAICLGLARLSEMASLQFAILIHAYPLLALIVLPAGFALIVGLTRRLAPEALEVSIPSIITALWVRESQRLDSGLSLRSALVQAAMLPLGLLVGASVGREGPNVKVGAAILSALGDQRPRWTIGLAAAGAGAALAATFHAPIAGFVFAIEAILPRLTLRSLALLILAIAAATGTGWPFVDGSPAIAIPVSGFADVRGWLAVPLVGVVGGMAGSLMCRLLRMAQDYFPGPGRQLIGLPPEAIAALCGLIVALCGLVSQGTTYGSGLDVPAGIDWTFAPFKALATMATAFAGLPGGVISPALSIGANLGADLAPFVPSVAIAAMALLGMIAFATGTLQMPFTALAIVAEMSGNSALWIPMLLVALIANATAQALSPAGLYHAQARMLFRRRLQTNP